MKAGLVRRALLAGCLAIAARGAGAQSLPDSLFDRATRAELDKVIAGARSAGLPVAPLVNRALQGHARGITGPRTVEVVRAYADSMRVASTVLGEGGSASEIDAGAAALRAGVSREDVRRVRRSREGRDVTTALIVLTDLVRRGVRGGDATDAVAAVGNAQGDDGLRALQREMAREGMPATTERLRATVQELRRRPEGSDELHQALDARALPMATRATAFAASAWRPSAATSAPSALLEGGLGVPLGRSGLAVSGAMRAGVDIADSMIAAFRGSVSFSRVLGKNLAGAGWVGMESRPVSLGGGAVRDTQQLASRADFRHRSPSWIAGGSVARGIGRGVALGAMAEVTGDEMLHRSLVWAQGPKPPTDTFPQTPDTATWSMQQRWLPAHRVFLRTAFTAAIRSLTLQASLSQRVAMGADPDSQAGRTLFALSGEQRLAQRVSLFAQMSSRDPVGVFGNALPAESRLRFGLRWREGRSLPPIGSLPEVRQPRSQVAVSLRQVADSAKGWLQLNVQAAQARVAWVEGDLTGWHPVALTRNPDGGFSGVFMARGDIVRLRIRLDDGAWQVPLGIARDLDEFGEVVGMVVVAPQ